MAMLPMKQGMRRAILYGGTEKSKQVITVGHCYFKLIKSFWNSNQPVLNYLALFIPWTQSCVRNFRMYLLDVTLF